MTDQPAFPPGPYHFTDQGYISIWAKGRPSLATLDMRFVSINEYKAMGHLFAAAPELLAALKRVTEQLARENHEDQDEAWVQARAAIRKAEGR